MKPNPGSKEAVDQGCECPVMDNHHGEGIQFERLGGGTWAGFWISENCPLHKNPNWREEDLEKEV